jgi:hypothetical protein
MNIPKRRFIGVGILIVTILAAATFQIFGHGLIVVTELHPSTPPELAAKGMDMAGGERIDYSRSVYLAIVAIMGFIMVVLPNHRKKNIS